MYISLNNKASSEDCKKLLQDVTLKNNWKRLTKFKRGSEYVRIFQSADKFAVVIEGNTFLSVSAIVDTLEDAKLSTELPKNYILSPEMQDYKDNFLELDNEDLYEFICDAENKNAIANQFFVELPQLDDFYDLEIDPDELSSTYFEQNINKFLFGFYDKYKKIDCDQPNGLEVLFNYVLESPNESYAHVINHGHSFNEVVSYLLKSGFEFRWGEFETHPVIYKAMADYMLSNK